MAAAPSSAETSRPVGWRARRAASSASGSGVAARSRRTQGVSAVPGLTQLTRIPSGRWSAAMARVSESTAPLVALYRARSGRPAVAAIEQVLTIAARPERRRWGKAARVVRTRRRRLTPRTRRHSSMGVSSTVPWAPMPALLTRTSSPPQRSATAAMAAPTEVWSVTSATKGSGLSAPSTGSAAADGSRSRAATLAPRAASSRTVASPIPEPPPVTAATRPSNSRGTARPPRQDQDRGKDRIFAVPVSTAVGEEQPVSTKDTAIRATSGTSTSRSAGTLGSVPCTPRASTPRSRGVVRAADRPDLGRHGNPRPARQRPAGRSPGRHRRAAVVGPPGPRRGRRPPGRGGLPPGVRRDGPGRTGPAWPRRRRYWSSRAALSSAGRKPAQRRPRDLLGQRLAPFVSWNLAGDHQAVDRSVLDGTVIPVSRQASLFSSRLRLTDRGPGSRREVHLPPIAVYWSLHLCCCSINQRPQLEPRALTCVEELSERRRIGEVAAAFSLPLPALVAIAAGTLGGAFDLGGGELQARADLVSLDLGHRPLLAFRGFPAALAEPAGDHDPVTLGQRVGQVLGLAAPDIDPQ